MLLASKYFTKSTGFYFRHFSQNTMIVLDNDNCDEPETNNGGDEPETERFSHQSQQEVSLECEPVEQQPSTPTPRQRFSNHGTCQVIGLN